MKLCEFRSKEELLTLWRFAMFLFFACVLFSIFMALFVLLPLFVLMEDWSAWWLVAPAALIANFVFCRNSIIRKTVKAVDKIIP